MKIHRQIRWDLIGLLTVLVAVVVPVLFASLYVSHHECFYETCAREVQFSGDFCQTCSDENAALEGEPTDTVECEPGKASSLLVGGLY